MPSPLPCRRRSLIPAWVPLFLLVLLQAESSAQVLTKDQQTCSAVMNASLDRVAATVGDEIAACIKGRAQGKLAGTVDECIAADPKERVAKAAQKTATDFVKKCSGESRPPYGVTRAQAVNVAATRNEHDLLHDVFGPSADAGIVSVEADKPAS